MSTYFNENQITEHDGANFVIEKVTRYSSPTETYIVSKYKKKNDVIFVKFNRTNEAEIYVGDCDSCGWNTTKAQYDGATWGDILYLGLHLGVTPDYIYNNKSVNSIDVVEGNSPKSLCWFLFNMLPWSKQLVVQKNEHVGSSPTTTQTKVHVT